MNGASVPYAAHVYVLNRPNNQDENHRNRAEGRQNVVVVPSRDAVIVRMGMTNGPGWPRSKFVAAVLEALPE